MKKVILSAIILLMLAHIVLAAVSIDVAITPKKSEFREGDLLAFDYSISSGARQNIVYAAHISCPQAPVAIIERKAASLQPGDALRGEYKGIVVDNGIEPQTCTASITIFSPENKVVKRNIRIAAAPSIDFTLSLCKDLVCTKQQRTFVKSEKVYLKGIAGATAEAQVIAPDGSSQKISLPGSFTASQSGEYKIEYTAAKAGYKQAKGSASIFVIEQAFTVPYADFSSKAGRAVVRPAYKEPLRTMSAAKTPAELKAPAKKSKLRGVLSRITGYFALIF